MKKLALTFIMCVSSLLMIAQERYSYNENKFTVTVENGLDIKKQISFALSGKDIELIKETENFKTSNEEDVIKYIWLKTISAVYRAKYQLKHVNSYDFIEDSEGSIYVSDNGILKISYKFKAQNGFGNYIYSTCYFEVYSKKGKEITKCNIF